MSSRFAAVLGRLAGLTLGASVVCAMRSLRHAVITTERDGWAAGLAPASRRRSTARLLRQTTVLTKY